MEKPRAQSRWWDWSSVILLFILLQIIASRLVITNWTKYLSFAQTFASIAIVIGLALGYSQFQRRTARWLSFSYMLIMLPLLWTRVIDQQVSLEEQLLSVGGRLLFSVSQFFARRPVEDPLFFVAIMSVTFWVMSASAGFQLTRKQNFLASVLPSALGLLILQNYDNATPSRLWILAFFAFFALFLLGRLNFLQEQKTWREKRVFLSPENSVDLTSGMIIAAGLIIIIAWNFPLSISRIDSARQAWSLITKPWNDFTKRMENAVSALESPSPGRSSEFYGTELALGQGLPLSESIMFEVQVPDLTSGEKPPRYYWRGRVYDHFSDGQWRITGTTREEFSPLGESLLVTDAGELTPRRFVFNTGESRFSLIYAPSEPVWVSRPGTFLTSPAEGNEDILSWNASPVLLPGETYQVDAILKNPNTQQLREAGTDYPAWVADKYLQLPDDFSPRIIELASQITADAETPYDQAIVITRYLREAIKYAPTIPAPPRHRDALEWVLFEYKQGYCVYYATAEVLMMRSLGIPARMAVGFAQGEESTSGENLPEEEAGFRHISAYTIRKLDAHAWPEVYFPGIGWVEFEPTGNQPALSRPLPPQSEDENANNTAPGEKILEDSLIDTSGELDEEPFEPLNSSDKAIPPLFYLLPLFIAFAALTIYLNRRYTLHTRLPILVRATIERSGAQAPNWIIRWEHWVILSPIERAFESINFALRQVKEPAPVHATPIERAKSLANILPNIDTQIKTLLDEHQTSLYTSRKADASKARRAAFHIRMQALIAVFRHFWTGAYSQHFTKT